MANPIDLTGATTIEGQLLMVLESLMNLQADTASNRDNVTIISASNYNDITGIQAVALSILVTSIGTADGYMLKADEVFYPKAADI